MLDRILTHQEGDFAQIDTMDAGENLAALSSHQRACGGESSVADNPRAERFPFDAISDVAVAKFVLGFKDRADPRRRHAILGGGDHQIVEREHVALRRFLTFDLAQVLGSTLHTARECMEDLLSAFPGDAGVPAMTIWLWEQGLAMPEEIANGQVIALVRWYVDRLRHQRHEGTVARLSRDLVWLYAELAGEPLLHTSYR